MKHWYALHVQARCEKKTSECLTGMGIENFLPVQSEMYPWEYRSEHKEHIVVPTMVFVHADESEMSQIQLLPHVVQLLKLTGEWIIPDKQIEKFRLLLDNSTEIIELCRHSAQAGEAVRVSCGPLKGLEGELVLAHTHTKMIVNNTPLGQIQMNMPLRFIERI